MFYAIMSGSVRKAVILGAVGAVILVSGNPIGAAPAPTQVPNSLPSAMTPGFVVLTQPVRVKIAYGETVLPAGMKLPVVSSDATSVRVKYMGELQTIPIGAARFEGSAADPPDTGPSETAPIVPTKPAAVPSTTPGTQPQVSLQPGYDSRMQGGDIGMRDEMLGAIEHEVDNLILTGSGLSGSDRSIRSWRFYEGNRGPSRPLRQVVPRNSSAENRIRRTLRSIDMAGRSDRATARSRFRPRQRRSCL